MAERDAQQESKRPLTISAAMCTYNGERYLPEQLQSILSQTETLDELVVCDDGSTDGTMSILRKFAAGAPFPVRLIVNTTNLRPAKNFAQCLALCRGNVIVLSDQDDVWRPDRVSQTRSVFAESPDVMFSFSDANLIDGEGKSSERTIYSSLPIHRRDRSRVRRGRDLFEVLMRWGVLYGATMAVRASALAAVLPIPNGWSHDEWISLVLSSIGQSHCMKHPVMSYRQHDTQEVGTGEWNAATHWQWAQSRGTGLYLREIAKYRSGVEAAQSNSVLRQKLLPELERKLNHLGNRVMVQRGNLGDLPLFLSMLIRGEYARYGSGLRSSLKDLSMLILGERLQARYAGRHS